MSFANALLVCCLNQQDYRPALYVAVTLVTMSAWLIKVLWRLSFLPCSLPPSLSRSLPPSLSPSLLPPPPSHVPRVQCVSVLLKAGASVDIQDTSGSTPLHNCATCGNLTSAKNLLAVSPFTQDAQEPLPV